MSMVKNQPVIHFDGANYRQAVFLRELPNLESALIQYVTTHKIDIVHKHELRTVEEYNRQNPSPTQTEHGSSEFKI